MFRKVPPESVNSFFVGAPSTLKVLCMCTSLRMHKVALVVHLKVNEASLLEVVVGPPAVTDDSAPRLHIFLDDELQAPSVSSLHEF